MILDFLSYFRNFYLYNEYVDFLYNLIIDNDISLNIFNG